MADVVRYINAASSSGGDGTTNSTSGANRAYSGIAEAIAAASSTKSSSDRWLVYVQGTAAETLSGSITISTSLNTTSANPLLFIDTSPTAVWSTTKYRLNASTIADPIQFTGGAAVIGFVGIQMESSRPLASFLRYIDIFGGTPTVLVDRVLARATGSVASPATGCGFVAGRSNSAWTARITNTICYGFESLINTPVYSATATASVANNTALTHVVGVGLANLDTGTTVNVHNNLIEAVAGTCYATPPGGWTTAGNISSDATSPQTGLRSLTATFVDRVGFDLRLSGSDTAARNTGTNISVVGAYSGLSIASSLDIIGTSRPQGLAWDIGAHEFIPSGPPVIRNPRRGILARR